ncbi:MAG: HugZ family protein [Alphaproteobacteria bacterium]
MSDDVPATARHLVRSLDRAALATAQRDAEGWPYASLVMVAHDQCGRPLMLLSDLAEHSKNIARDGRVSLLFDGTGGLARPLTGARATVLGRAVAVDDAAARARYLARHPDAAFYAGFPDFRLYRVEVEQAHLVAGFGRIHWVEGAAIVLPENAPALADAEAGIVGHMNDDHGDAVQLYARMLGSDAVGWRMTGVDPEGADLRLGGDVLRLPFAAPITDAKGARVELVRLVGEARRRLGQASAA